MIVSRWDGRILMVRQVDHQTQCRRMADAWGGEGFARIGPWEPLALAAGCHDEGWRPFDDAPEAGVDGAPLDFPDLPRARHVALYARGIEAACARDARTGLLVSMHGQGLHEERLGLDGPPKPRDRQEPAVRRFLEDQDALQAALRERIADPGLHAWAWDGYRILQAVDVLSLYLLWYGLPRGATGRLVRVPRFPGDPGVDIAMAPDGPGACTLDPYPFAEPEVALPVDARWIPERAYASDDDLREALDRVPWEVVEVRARRPRG